MAKVIRVLLGQKPKKCTKGAPVVLDGELDKADSWVATVVWEVRESGLGLSPTFKLPLSIITVLGLEHF